MLDFIFNFFMLFILVTGGLLFSILAYTLRKQVFFYLGISAIAIVSIGLVRYFEFYKYAILAGDLVTIGVFMAWLISIVFLILSKIEKKPADDGVTDAFLDDIINAEDEEWDPES